MIGILIIVGIVVYIIIGGASGYIYYLFDIGVTHYRKLKNDIFGPVAAGIFWPISIPILIGVFCCMKFIVLKEIKVKDKCVNKN